MHDYCVINSSWLFSNAFINTLLNHKQKVFIKLFSPEDLDGSALTKKETEPWIMENVIVEWNVLIPGFEQFDINFFSADSPPQLSNLIT